MARIDGFGVIELLAGLAVALAAVGTGATALATLAGSVRLAGAADELASAMRAARSEALARGRRIDVRFDPPMRAWSVRAVDGPVLETHRLPDQVAFASLPQSLRIGFTSIGTADNATVVITGGSRTRSVIVNQRGRVRVQ